MTLSGAAPASGGVGRRLRLGPLHQLAAELKTWRRDPVSDEQPRGGILDFVWGLRLSAQLIYALRAILSPRLQVDWGHLLDGSECLCSPECDVIIHEPGPGYRWNGQEHPVMDFRFVNHTRAKAVVSCKSLVRSVDKQYCKNMQQYVANVFLFGECCEPGTTSHLKTKALQAGYKGFCCLYEFNRDTSECLDNEPEWASFLSEIERTVT